MRMPERIEYHCESVSVPVQERNEWPLPANLSDQLVACHVCFYPVTLDIHIADHIRDYDDYTFGVIVPIRKLLRNIVIHDDNPVEQWKTTASCPQCATRLTFSNLTENEISIRDFGKVLEFRSVGEQVVLLSCSVLYFEPAQEIRRLFRVINY